MVVLDCLLLIRVHLFIMLVEAVAVDTQDNLLELVEQVAVVREVKLVYPQLRVQPILGEVLEVEVVLVLMGLMVALEL
jgi:hypothetical protein